MPARAWLRTVRRSKGPLAPAERPSFLPLVRQKMALTEEGQTLAQEPRRSPRTGVTSRGSARGAWGPVGRGRIAEPQTLTDLWR
jgi:hypothetical protein